MLDQIVLPEILKPRAILPRLLPLLAIDDILVLSGARQVGKTYLLYLLLRHLRENLKISEKQIFFFNLEDPMLLQKLNKISIKDFVSDLEKAGADIKKKTWVFIDEIQYLNYPSSFLKQIFDLYPQIKLIVSGSSSLEMKKKFTDRLTGRKRFIEVLPLSLDEAAQFQGRHISGSETEDYLLFGGYPRVVLQANPVERRNILLNIYNDYVRKDVKDAAKIIDLGGFNNLVGLAAGQIGNLFSESKISSEIGLSRPTVKKYLHLLETTFVLDMVSPYSQNLRREFVRMPKVFFKDTGLRNAIVGGFLPLSARSDAGAVLENGAYLEIVKNMPDFSEVYFWRTKSHQEVDFILRDSSGKITPIEVKAQLGEKFRLSSSLRAFINRYKPKTAVIACLAGEVKEKYGKTEICSVTLKNLARFLRGEEGN